MALWHRLRTVLYRTIFVLVEQTFEFVSLRSECSFEPFNLYNVKAEQRTCKVYMLVKLLFHVSTKLGSWKLWSLIERTAYRSTIFDLVIQIPGAKQGTINSKWCSYNWEILRRILNRHPRYGGSRCFPLNSERLVLWATKYNSFYHQLWVARYCTV